MVSSIGRGTAFSFICASLDDISNQIKRLDIRKRNTESDIPAKNRRFRILISAFLTKKINYSLIIFKINWFIKLITNIVN